MIPKRIKGKVKTANVNVFDGLQNFSAMLGLGTGSLLSKGNYKSNESQAITLNREILENMYRSSWMVGKVVDVIAEDMTKDSIELTSSDGAELIDDMLRQIRRIGISDQLANGIRWGNLYGGAIAILLIEGEDFEQPLNIDAIQRDTFKGLYVIDRWFAIPSFELVSDYGSSYGLPEYYEVLSYDGVTRIGKVHHTRVIRFIGHELPYAQKIKMLMWGQSIVERIYDRILIYDSATYGGANLLLKSFLRTLKVSGLRQNIAAGGIVMENVAEYVNMVGMYQNSENILLIDSEDEIETSNWSFSGIDKALTQFGEQMAGCTGIPLVRFFGQPPGGFNSSGEIDMRNYYDHINVKQEAQLRPAYDKLIPVIAMSLYGRQLEVGWQYTFGALWQPSDVEKAEIAKLDADTVSSLVSAGIFTPEMALRALRYTARWSRRYSDISDEDFGKVQLMNEQRTIDNVAEDKA